MKKTPHPKTATPPAAAPEWVTETLPDHTYCLNMYENADVAVDDIDLTRDEYIDLKQHLAGMRGIIPAAAAAEPPAAKNGTVDLIAWFAEIEAANCGTDTPAEAFISILVMTHHQRGLTPDVAALRLEEFRENFDCMAEAARNFTARYPKAVQEPAPATA